MNAIVGERIRALRQARGWSLSALAASSGVGKATLSEIESGRRNPTLETLYAVAAQLGVGLSALLAEPGPDAAELSGDAVSGTLVAVYRDPTVVTEIYRLRIRPGRRQLSPGHGPGVIEHLFVTAGEVVVGPVAAPFTVVAGGDGVWESSGPHVYEAVGPAEAVLVIRHPRRSDRPQ